MDLNEETDTRKRDSMVKFLLGIGAVMGVGPLFEDDIRRHYRDFIGKLENGRQEYEEIESQIKTAEIIEGSCPAMSDFFMEYPYSYDPRLEYIDGGWPNSIKRKIRVNPRAYPHLDIGYFDNSPARPFDTGKIAIEAVDASWFRWGTIRRTEDIKREFEARGIKYEEVQFNGIVTSDFTYLRIERAEFFGKKDEIRKSLHAALDGEVSEDQIRSAIDILELYTVKYLEGILPGECYAS